MTALGRHSTFVVTKFYLGGGDTKVATINVRSFNIHTPEPLHLATDRDDGGKADAATTSTTGDTKIIDSASVKFFDTPEPDHLNDEAFIVVVAEPMVKTPSRTLSSLTNSGVMVVEDVSSHLMGASTVEIPPLPPLPRLLPIPQNIPVPLPPSPLPPILAPRTPLPHSGSPG